MLAICADRPIVLVGDGEEGGVVTVGHVLATADGGLLLPEYMSFDVGIGGGRILKKIVN